MDPFLGEIRMFAFGFIPRGWLACSGSLLPIQQYSALFSILGTTYGGNGTTNFALPNLNGNVPVGTGTSPGGSTFDLGQAAGSTTTVMDINSLPAHNHVLNGAATVSTASETASAYPGSAAGRAAAKYITTSAQNIILNPAAIGVTGSGNAIPIMQPYLVVYYGIAIQGVFPTRN